MLDQQNKFNLNDARLCDWCFQTEELEEEYVTFKNVTLNKKNNPFDERCLTEHEHKVVVDTFARKEAKRGNASNFHDYDTYKSGQTLFKQGAVKDKED